MSESILDVKAELEAAGLEVKPSGEHSLWIAASTRETGGGLRLSNDASTLIQQEDRWMAVFPAPGMLSYEVPGDLRDLIPLIRRVYADYRHSGGAFKDAFKRSVPGSELYLVGQFDTEDLSTRHPAPRGLDFGTDC